MKRLSLPPTRAEIAWGISYLAFEFLLMPVLLSLVNMLLPEPLNEARLNFIYFAINFLAVALIFRRLLRGTLDAVKNPRIIPAAIRGLGLYWLGNLMVAMLILRLDPDFANVNDASIAAMADEDFFIIAFGTVVLVPPAEEFLFRGALFGGLYNRSRTAAYAVSAALFSAIHVVGYIGLYPVDTLLLCFIQYIPAGLALGWAYARADSILAPILMHILINGSGILLLR